MFKSNTYYLFLTNILENWPLWDLGEGDLFSELVLSQLLLCLLLRRLYLLLEWLLGLPLSWFLRLWGGAGSPFSSWRKFDTYIYKNITDSSKLETHRDKKLIFKDSKKCKFILIEYNKSQNFKLCKIVFISIFTFRFKN